MVSIRRVSQLFCFWIVLLSLQAPAHAVCSTANQYRFNFTTPAAASLNYASTYNYAATSTALGSQSFNVSFVRNNLTTAAAGGENMPALTALISDGVSARSLVIGGIFGARSNAAFTTNYVETVFTFTSPIRDFSVQVNDVDFTTNQFRDWVQFVGTNGAASYTPSLTTPFGTNNIVGGPKTNASSSMVLGASTTPVAVTVSQAAGTGASGNNATTGTITASFAQPVTVIRLRWGNYPLQAGETATGQQAIGIQSVSWCPMPSITLIKSSAPWSDPINGTNNPKLIPGGDLIYTLTVANTNSSPIDANALFLTDPLPAAFTFYNGDIDDSGPLTTNFNFVPGSSGLTLAASNLSYSNNAGSSYAYNPVAGYDAAANALRLAPQGSMAANSSFSVSFRGRIK
jgi:uncharacterized repeat protein (TIGR01451 family)